MHIYAFGSVCRGEVDDDSDIDMLAVIDENDRNVSEMNFSIYSQDKLKAIWREGNPFAWHLRLESAMVFSSDGTDIIESLGEPSKYSRARADCLSFIDLFDSAATSIRMGTNSIHFELSTIFIAARNFAICYSFEKEGRPVFSRQAPLLLGEHSLRLPSTSYSTLERSRILASRGIGEQVERQQLNSTIEDLPKIRQWMTKLMEGLTL
ncbi:nucleotidyltransferase [Stenotrophomonas sp. SPM]|uniref:nucleotidyltransferase domain-containing protein n=1 Tax=Stenotrophomonas sp. SPM TaxID=2170735 RepID=UPI000DE65051|nr:nucleotidyltransferase domain-containing protein [Stenotrophomonas sp. SPM]PWB28693.1 nucleotidyltransferase [Stenotrophomonas sp. SPM]